MKFSSSLLLLLQVPGARPFSPRNYNYAKLTLTTAQQTTRLWSNDDWFDGYDEFVDSSKSKTSDSSSIWDNNRDEYVNVNVKTRAPSKTKTSSRGGYSSKDEYMAGDGDFHSDGGRGTVDAGRDRGNHMNEHGHDYTQTGGPIQSSLSEGDIHALIRERLECKIARDFSAADDLQAQLLGLGVEIHDGYKEWRADGESWTRSSDLDSHYFYQQRGPGRGLSEEQISVIDALVAERAEAKTVREYSRADAVWQTLTETHKVMVDDRNREWGLFSEMYVLASNSAFVPSENVDIAVGSRLGVRNLAKMNRKFDLADEIREELREEYGVEIYDRSKEWTMEIPAEGTSWEAEGDQPVEDIVVERTDDEFNPMAGEGNNASFDESTLSAMKVPDLKQMLRDAGLKMSGTKPELIDRLLNAPAEDSWETEENNDLLFDDFVVKSTEDADEGMTGEGNNAPFDVSTLSLMKVPDLKQRLRDAGLKVSGNKQELIDRLLNA